MVVPFVFLVVLPVLAAFLGLYQAWLTHQEQGYRAETASSLVMLPWVPLLLGISVFVVIDAVQPPDAFANALSIAVGLAALGASVAAGLTGKLGLGELLGDDKPYVASGLNVPLVLTTAAICAALVMIGLADLAVVTVFSVGAATGAGAAAAGGAHFWAEDQFPIERRELLAIFVAAAILTFLVMRFAGY